MRSLKNYTVVLRPDDNGTFVAYIPAITGCHAWGQTTEEAQAVLMKWAIATLKQAIAPFNEVLPQAVVADDVWTSCQRRFDH